MRPTTKPRRPVVLLTDFGLVDCYVGVLHAVIAAQAPGADRIDLGHMTPPGDIWAGAFSLLSAWAHLPPDAVVLAVIDPGVGSKRAALAVHHGERVLIAPDNGLAMSLGPGDDRIALSAQAMGVESLSSTFHGRDLFAPAAARLACGAELGSLGTPVAIDAPVPSPLPEPVDHLGTLVGAILHIDRFGNLITNIPSSAAGVDYSLRVGLTNVQRRRDCYVDSEARELFFLAGSIGTLEVSVSGASAARLIAAHVGDQVELLQPRQVLLQGVGAIAGSESDGNSED